MKLTYSKPILHEHSNKKRSQSTVCDEMCFHGRSRKAIILLHHLVRSVVSKLGAVNVRGFRRHFGKNFWNRHNRKTKAKENKKVIWFRKVFVSRSLKIAVKTAMASWPGGRANRGNNRLQLPSVQQKSKIPVRMTQVSSDSDNSSSTEDKMKKRRHLPRKCVDNFPPSRIRVSACVKKNNKGSERKA